RSPAVRHDRRDAAARSGDQGRRCPRRRARSRPRRREHDSPGARLAVGNGVDPARAYPRFVARPPWWGGDLQTVRNYLRKPAIPLEPYPAERLEFPLDDGSGDVLVATLNPPRTAHGARPLVVLVHGLTGCETSTYMRASARHLLERGHPVLRLNLRGAGPSRARCRLQYHAGRTEDLRAVVGRMDGRLAANGVVIVGFSLGGNML